MTDVEAFAAARRQDDERYRDRVRTVAARAAAATDVRLEEGWTVSGTIAHIGLWDQFAAARWRAARGAGALVPDQFPRNLVDLVNAATLPLLANLSLDRAVTFAMNAADELDLELRALAPEAVAEALRLERRNLVDRSRHRFEHLDALERALGSQPPSAPPN